MPEIAPQAADALRLLESAGFEAYLVGGAVRNALSGVPVRDWDIATDAKPGQVADVFAGCRLIETGRRHGTLTAVVGGMPLEITTYRIDGPYSDRRRPDGVTFTDKITDDLARRDFTVNAMAYHPAQGLVDPFGGAEDLRRGVLRCVGEPDRRLGEDPLRILRALRFSAVFSLTAEPGTAAALHRGRELLSGVSAERLQSELTKMLCGSRAEAVLNDYADVLTVPIPELAPMICLGDGALWRHTAAAVGRTAPSPILRWAALFRDMGAPALRADEKSNAPLGSLAAESARTADSVMRRLRFGHTMRQRILLLTGHSREVPEADEAAVRRALRRFGPEALGQLIDLSEADAADDPAVLARLRALVARCACGCVSLRGLAVNGHDLTALGLRGREVGQALSALLDSVVDGALPNERAALLAFLRTSGRLPADDARDNRRQSPS